MTVTRVGKTNSALRNSRRARTHSIGAPMSAPNRRAEIQGDSRHEARARVASLTHRPRIDTAPPPREGTNSVFGAAWRRARASSGTKLAARISGPVIARRDSCPRKGVTGSEYEVTESGPVGVRILHGRNRLRRIRGAGNGLCYRGNRHRHSCLCGRGFHASDVAPLPRGNGQLEYLRCWRLLWSRTLIWARRSASAGLVPGQDESIRPGPKRSQPAH